MVIEVPFSECFLAFLANGIHTRPEWPAPELRNIYPVSPLFLVSVFFCFTEMALIGGLLTPGICIVFVNPRTSDTAKRTFGFFHDDPLIWVTKKPQNRGIKKRRWRGGISSFLYDIIVTRLIDKHFRYTAQTSLCTHVRFMQYPSRIQVSHSGSQHPAIIASTKSM